MPNSEIYTGLSGSVAVAQTTALPICSVFGTAAKRLWVVGVRVKLGVTAAVADGGGTLLTLRFDPIHAEN